MKGNEPMLATATPTLDDLLPTPGANPFPPVPSASRSLEGRDEFGPITGPLALLSSATAPRALEAREDLGHALCAWAPPEDLL